MSLTGILLDVSRSMECNIGSGADEEGGSWARSIFKVIDDLIKHDASSENEVFALGVGASCGEEIFDVIGTVQQIEEKRLPHYRKNMPATLNNINRTFDILERFGARNIRKWAKVSLVQEVVSDCMAALILMKLESDEQFVRKFVDEFLPSACRDTIGVDSARRAMDGNVVLGVIMQPILLGLQAAASVENKVTTGVSYFKSATAEDIHQVVEKAKCYFIKEVGTNSIFSVQEASRIIRGYVDEKELSKERSQELLENVEPFIYGRTPLYQSLDKATELFHKNSSKYANHNKLLFVLSDGEPTDGEAMDGNEDTKKIDQVVSKLREEGVKVVSCFITESTDIQPKRLYDEMPPDWEPGAKFLFSLSSELPTQLLPRAIFVKRGWTIDVANNETKLFMQVNHPDHLREACNMARDVVCCQDALSDLLVSVDLDIYITQSTDSFEAKKQGGKACYAYASATVLHLAMKRILGREGGYPEFKALRDEMIKGFGGVDGANTSQVLDEVCPKYRLHCRDVNPKEAMQAIVEKRPVVATFRLTEEEWKIFRNFSQNDPTGILTEKEIDVCNRNAHDATKGHAVVLTSYNSKCLTLLNSQKTGRDNMGFFRVQNADVLEMDFFDVYWTLEELTEGEKKYYDDHGSEVVAACRRRSTRVLNAA